MDTTAEILDACIFLGKKDVKVTVNSVREYRGFGSNSTIGPIVALYNRNSEMFKTGEAPASLKLAATAALDKVFGELKETMISEIDSVLSSKEEMSANHNSELKRRSDELQEMLTEKKSLKADLKQSQDSLKLSEDHLSNSIKSSIELQNVNSALQDQVESLGKSLERGDEERKLNTLEINKLNIALALSEEKNQNSTKELGEKAEMINSMSLSLRDEAAKNEAEKQSTSEAIVQLNRDLNTAKNSLLSKTSELQAQLSASNDKLSASDDKLATSEDKLQLLLADIKALKASESAIQDSLARQKRWFGRVITKTVTLLNKNKTKQALSALDDALDAHETL